MTFKRVDRNQTEIVKAARQMGATVQILSAVGHGCPDLLIGYRGINYLCEIKDGNKTPSARKLTFCEKNWHETWNGRVAIVESVDDLVRMLSA